MDSDFSLGTGFWIGWFIFVVIIIAIIMYVDFAKSFGKSAAFGWGLALLGFIFFPILAWGDAQYQGPPAS